MEETAQLEPDVPMETPEGHPKGLYVLFFSEMWERFCYYGMRALLILYLVKSLAIGDNDAFLIYGAYTGLVYVAPVLGGKIADTLIGYKNAVILGGILMAIGEFMIIGGELFGGAIDSKTWLYAGMGAIIVGNGYFKANISTIVGKLYKEGDPRRDSEPPQSALSSRAILVMRRTPASKCSLMPSSNSLAAVSGLSSP